MCWEKKDRDAYKHLQQFLFRVSPEILPDPFIIFPYRCMNPSSARGPFSVLVLSCQQAQICHAKKLTSLCSFRNGHAEQNAYDNVHFGRVLDLCLPRSLFFSYGNVEYRLILAICQQFAFWGCTFKGFCFCPKYRKQCNLKPHQ